MTKLISIKEVLMILFMIAFVSCSSLRTNKQSTSEQNSFSQDQIDLIMNADSTSPMRIFKINNKKDSVLLRTRSSDVVVNPEDPILKIFINRLYKTVRDSISMGVGIAAPQVGILKNIIWVQRFDKENFPFEVYLNPKINQYSDLKQAYREGCLSIPNRSDTVKTRSYAIFIEYDQIDKKHKCEMVEGFTSVIFQHEIDHLNGILYLDHLEEEQKGVKH